ncbi:hypothetical protein GUITHDRAFT_116877 [Guillardia theta CCMP2712]|uniref:Uncharacterized protein n=1 Tax=Guillardia theta (strain CCMP2712) TaxID=905079 RepID=L1ILL1_GUITC|nr:hypothetical protein GUITHDRAFT_116877 [Guillardia theta CCMP2712]EKX37012.1 hypothetical protein GUITHDRAFT_116877 [Guillardia theta CCMP2712]|eukprot:XP_005823992.1 hypothetical protein GUITHDRAFT_116877 [Guillardia theta CCMP2712]
MLFQVAPSTFVRGQALWTVPGEDDLFAPWGSNKAAYDYSYAGMRTSSNTGIAPCNYGNGYLCMPPSIAQVQPFE